MKVTKVDKLNGDTVYICHPDFVLKSKHDILFNLLKTLIKPTKYSYSTKNNSYDDIMVFMEKSFYLKTDLKSCFETVSYKRVVGALKKLGVPDPRENAKNITFKGTLMRGASPSNIILDYILTSLDFRLDGLARKNGLFYARYVDDLFFFGWNSFNATELYKKIKMIVESEDFKINESKTKSNLNFEM